MNKTNKTTLCFFELLAILFIALKLTGHITWSWVWVLAPIWAPIVIGIAIMIIVVIIVVAIDLLIKHGGK